MVQYSDQDQVWLVKSANVILGPFSLIQLTQALKERRVSLLDEVRTPSDRWAFIRENTRLSELVRAIREAESNHGSNTGKTSIEGDEDERNPSISNTIKIEQQAPPVEATPRITATPIALVPRPMKGVPKPPKRVDFPLPIESEKPSRMPLLIGFFFGVICLGAAAFYFFGMPMAKPVAAPKPTADILGLARIAKANGFYDKSLMMFDRVVAEGIPDSNLKYEIVPLLLQQQKNFARAQQYLSELSQEKNLSSDMEEKISNWTGLLLMRQGQLTAASQKLNEALSRFPSSKIISVNLSINELLENHFDRVLLVKDSNSPLIAIAQGMALLLQPAGLFLPARAKSLSTELVSWSTQRKDLAFETLLIAAVLSDRAGDEPTTSAIIDKVLDQSVGVTHAYVRDLDFEYGFTEALHLKPFCENLAAHQMNRSRGAALGAQCEAEIDGFPKALGILEQAERQFPGDPRLSVLHAEIFQLQGHFSEAKPLVVSNTTRPGLLTLSRVCLELNDLNCADSAIKLLQAGSKDQSDLESVYILAQFYNKKNRRDLAVQMVDKAMHGEQKYKPITQLKEELGEL